MKNQIRLSVATPSKDAFVSITSRIRDAVTELGLKDGLVHLHALHTTCGLTINENADPDVLTDLRTRLEEMVVWNHPQDRHGEGNSAAHLKCSLMGTSLSVPVQNGVLALGTWQGIFLAEFDGPRNRSLIITAIGCD
ncbi:MAG: secondary thiamine-phosphate synthase enzyme YjbQ [Deltaproteobacteria bacterium]|nr:secondary thiamine-phosphate synthase enzyme YjbQ [Deltaproteobacteria bacterium]